MSDILDYLEARSPQGAESVKRRLKAAIDLLG
jgi:plasmid stabilization system protein ParE